jgi:hypothetical protein
MMRALGVAAIAAGGMIALAALFAKSNAGDEASVGQILHPTTKSAFGCTSQRQFKELIVQMKQDSGHAFFDILTNVDNGDCHLFDTNVVVDGTDSPPGTVRVHECGSQREYWTYAGFFTKK